MSRRPRQGHFSMLELSAGSEELSRASWNSEGKEGGGGSRAVEGALVGREGVAARRFRLVREARLKRARMVEEKNANAFVPPPPNKPYSSVKQQPRGKIIRSANHQETSLLDNKQSYLLKGPSIHSDGTSPRDVSKVEAYLKSFEDGTYYSEADFDLDPESTLYKYANRPPETEGDFVVPPHLSSPEDDLDQDDGGIFNLTGLTGEQSEGVERTKESENQTGEMHHQNKGQLTVVTDNIEILDGFVVPFSKLGRSYKKARDKEMKALISKNSHRSREDKHVRAETKAPEKHELGRTRHLSSRSSHFLLYEIDVLKHISIREDILFELKTVHSFIQSLIVELRAYQKTIASLREASAASRRKKKKDAASTDFGSALGIVSAVGQPGKEQEQDRPPTKAEEALEKALLREKSMHRQLARAQDELRLHISRIRPASAHVAHAIKQWRDAVQRAEVREGLAPSFAVFDYKGQNYLLQMNRDLLFLDGKGKQMQQQQQQHSPPNSATLQNPGTAKNHHELKIDLACLDKNPAPHYEQSASELVARWLGLGAKGNPLLLWTDEDFIGNFAERLVNECSQADREQEDRQKKGLKTLLLGGLLGGKSATDIFKQLEPSPTSRSGKGAAKTQRVGLRAAARAILGRAKARKGAAAAGIENDDVASPMSARTFQEELRRQGRYVGTSEDNASANNDWPEETDAAGTSRHNAWAALGLASPATGKSQGLAQVQDEDDAESGLIESTAEYIARHFDLGLMPDAPLAPAHLFKGKEIQHFQAAVSIIQGEAQRFSDFVQERLRDQERESLAYDPFQQPNHHLLEDVVPDSAHVAKDWLRRRQEEGNPRLNPDDQGSGSDAAARAALINRKEHRQVLASDKLNGELLRRTKEERTRVIVTTTRVGRQQIRVADSVRSKHLHAAGGVESAQNQSPSPQDDNHDHHHHQQQQQQQVQPAAAAGPSFFQEQRAKREQVERRIHMLRKRQHRLSRLSSRDEAALREAKLELQVLQCGYLPGALQEAEEKEAYSLLETVGSDGHAHDALVLAATKIQSVVRMFLAKESVQERLGVTAHHRSSVEDTLEALAAICIQAHWRGWLGRKRAQLEEATIIMERERERERREREIQSHLKERQLQEIKSRGNRRRTEIQRESAERARQQAVEAAKKAQAAKLLTRQFRRFVDSNRREAARTNQAAVTIQRRVRSSQAKSRKMNLLMKSQEERATVKIQAALRGMSTRIMYQELKASEKRRVREEYKRKRDRERYAKLYTPNARGGRSSYNPDLARDVHRLSRLPSITAAQAPKRNSVVNENLAKAALSVLQLPDIGGGGGASPKERRRPSKLSK